MSNFFRKTLFFARRYTLRTPSPPSTSYLDFCEKTNFLRYSSTRSDQQQHAFTVTYLINSFGFSRQSALSASRYVCFENSEKPDSVVEVLKDYGFTQTQISNLVKRCPIVLSMDTEKIILAKLHFLQAKGVSKFDITKLVTGYPHFLRRSLTNMIIPSYDFFKNLFQSDEKVFIAIKRFLGILTLDIEHYLAPNFEILQHHGVPKSNIVTLIQNQPRALLKSPDMFRKIVEEVKEMGFDPGRRNFLGAVFAMRTMTKSTWEMKVGIFKKWGLSEEEVFQAFRRHPGCMMCSEKKIMEIMSFLINKMGLEPSIFAKYPTIFTYSLEKRIVPRGSVIRVLLSKGLLKKNCNPPTYLSMHEELFLQRYIFPYGNESSKLLELYKEKLSLSNQQKTEKV